MLTQTTLNESKYQNRYFTMNLIGILRCADMQNILVLNLKHVFKLVIYGYDTIKQKGQELGLHNSYE